MAQQAIIETIFKSVIEMLPKELGALLGQELTCSDTQYKLTSKEALFAGDPRPKSSLAHLNVVGDHEGEAFLILPTRTSIIFGGTLIMLPEDQIEENARKEKLDGEVADAYGEVANILAGVLTQVFLDKYSKSLRFVRTEVEELDSSSVDVASDAPFPPGSYFSCNSQLSMDDTALGLIELIIPAVLLDLEEATPSESVEDATKGAETPAAAKSEPAAEPQSEPAVEEAPAVKEEPPAAPARPPFADVKKLADIVLKATIEQVSEEVGALLGQTFVCSDLKLEMVTKSDFFGTHCLEKSILTHFDVSGSASGKTYLINEIKNAILMGGTLIMLPDEEIETSMGKGDFEGEVSDAFGEVANIISGGLTQTFMDRFPQPLRFVKTTSEAIVPTKLNMAEEAPLPEGLYYLASCAVSLQGTVLERMHLLFPAEILGLDDQVAAATQVAASGETSQTQANNETTTEQTSGQPDSPASKKSAGQTAPQSSAPPPTPPPADAKPVILVITDAPETVESINTNLKNDNYDVKVIGYKDDVRSVFSAHPVLGVFLMMSEVGEKGFSVAIKLQSSGYTLPPVIAGGPEWTRSAVLKAVKYGARDILVTPASDEEIRNKANLHISIPA